MASPLPLHRSNPPLLSGVHRRPLKSHFSIPILVRRNPNANSIFSHKSPISASSSSSWEREEARWLREEQRWIREEQRWLREESRWRSEREALLAEIAALRSRIDASERDLTGMEAVVSKQRRITAAEPRLALAEEADVKEMVLEEVRVSEVAEERKEEVGERKVEWRMLRMGAEGEDVRAMQEALQSLGFYPGEEDLEYSSFSSGTERAVKTWQATIGIPEDGIMTSELLARLFMERGATGSSLINGANGAAVASVTEIADTQQTVVKESSDSEVEASQQKVFLLGENRWEDPSRLTQKNRPIGTSNVSATTTKCLTCRGEGRLMCTECDGTGEPNIEPQFLEWVGEETKCPYCEGLGYTVCDVCEGKTITVEN